VNNTYIGIPPLKAQYDYMFKNCGEHGFLGRPGYAYLPDLRHTTSAAVIVFVLLILGTFE